MVATAGGRLSHYLLGADYPPRDLKFALIEAAGGRIGSPLDRALLYCYRYDPAQGRYGVLTFRLLRISGAITVLALAAFVGGSWWHQRRREGKAAWWHQRRRDGGAA
jgi:protein SCO1